MPQSFTDQFYLFDPAVPPASGTAVTWSSLVLTDQNVDNDFDRFNNDSVNGSDITASYRGDTVTINVPGVGNVTYTGVTFYLANGQRVFTPNDGQVLQAGTFVSSTSVPGQGSLLVNQLGPPCFTPGTMIRGAAGLVAVESLRVGDLVQTVDHGQQPLRWIGVREVDGFGDLAPVVIAAGALGNTRDLLVSPEHRMLVSGWFAELHFGEADVLIAARHLIGLPGIARRPVAHVTYVHLLFDRHEIIFAEDAPTESFHPGSWLLESDRALRAEVLAIFLELADRRDVKRLRPARHGTTRKEAQLLVASGTVTTR